MTKGGSVQQSPEHSDEVADGLMTIREAAAYLRLSVGGLYHLTSRGLVPCVRLSRRCLRFRKSQLDEFIEQKSVAAK